MKRLALCLALFVAIGCKEAPSTKPTPLEVGDTVTIKGATIVYSVTKIDGCKAELLHVDSRDKPGFWGTGGKIEETRLTVPISALKRFNNNGEYVFPIEIPAQCK